MSTLTEALQRSQDWRVNEARKIEEAFKREARANRERSLYIEQLFEDDPGATEDIVRKLTDVRDLIDAAIRDAQASDMQRVARSAVLISELKNGVDVRLKMYIPLHIAADAIARRHHDE
jgi:hypothetical protein